MRFISHATFSLPLAGLVLASSLMGSPAEPIKHQDTPTDSTHNLLVETQVSDRLRQIQSRAAELRLEAELLQAYSRGSGLSWETHAAKLSLVRDHINAIGRHLQYLQSVQGSSSPLQQAAINRMMPSAVAIADKTTAAIGLLNENRMQVSMPAYADHVQVLYEQADRLKNSVDPFVELEKAQKKVEMLQNTIDLEEIEW
jgi:hypothetical protein